MCRFLLPDLSCTWGSVHIRQESGLFSRLGDRADAKTFVGTINFPLPDRVPGGLPGSMRGRNESTIGGCESWQSAQGGVTGLYVVACSQVHFSISLPTQTCNQWIKAPSTIVPLQRPHVRGANIYRSSRGRRRGHDGGGDGQGYRFLRGKDIIRRR